MPASQAAANRTSAIQRAKNTALGPGWLEEPAPVRDHRDAAPTKGPRRLQDLAAEMGGRARYPMLSPAIAEADADQDHQPDLQLALTGEDRRQHQRRLPGDGTPNDSRPMIAGNR